MPVCFTRTSFGASSFSIGVPNSPCALFSLDMRLQRFDLLFGETSRKPRHHQPFEPKPDVKRVSGLFPCRRRNGGSAVATQLHESLGRQLTQCISDNCSARAETFTDRIFRELRAGLERLFDDRVAKSAIYRSRPIGVWFCLRLGDD